MGERRTHLLAALLLMMVLGSEISARGAFPGNNGRIAFSRYDGSGSGADIYSLDPDGSDLVTLRAECGEEIQVEWGADGTQFAYLHSGFTEEGSFRSVIKVSANPSDLGVGSHPSWAPDGARIAFSDASGLVVMGADGSNRQRIYDDGNGYIRAVAWSPVGDQIAFVAGNSGEPPDVLSIKPDGTALRVLLTSPDFEEEIDWSPDARFLVFTRRVGSGLADLYLADVGEQTGLTKLTDTPDIDERNPAFSPDGTRIAYTESFGRGGTRSIVLIDGAGNKTDVPNSAGAFDIDWQATPTSPATPAPSAEASQSAHPTASVTGGTGSFPPPSTTPSSRPCPGPTFAPCPRTAFSTCAPPQNRSRQISLESGVRRVRFGGEVTLTGAITSQTATCIPDQPVTIQRISPMPEENLVTVRTNPDGTFSATISPDETASYIARVDAGTCDPAESAPVPIEVRVAVRLRFVDLGDPLTRVVTSVKPCSGHTATQITVQRRGENGFRRIAMAKLDDDCRARNSMRLIPGAYRALWPKQDDDHEAGISNLIRAH